MRETEPHKAIDYILTHGSKFAKAKAQRVYLEEFMKGALMAAVGITIVSGVSL